jgi:hypothetical protein
MLVYQETIPVAITSLQSRSGAVSASCFEARQLLFKQFAVSDFFLQPARCGLRAPAKQVTIEKVALANDLAELDFQGHTDQLASEDDNG